MNNEDSSPYPAQQESPDSILRQAQPQPSERNHTDKQRKAGSTIPLTFSTIDKKRKQLECQLSANQQNQVLINKSKEDSQFKEYIAEAMRQSDKTFANSMQWVNSSIVQVGEILAQVIQWR